MINKIALILIFLILTTSCTKYIHDYKNLVIEDGKYDTEFPHRNCSRELDGIIKSTRMITCVGYYKEFVFSIDDQITLQNLDTKKAIKTTNYNNTSTGTATIISKKNRQVVMLTCAHVVKTPDKIVSYFDDPDDNYIASVAFLKRKMIFCSDLNTRKIDVLVANDQIDIALLGAVAEEDLITLPVLDYPLGNTQHLEWGSFVYLFGYPRGYKMVSHGVVSLSKPRIRRHFYVDAPFNRGFSGGLVMAIRDGVPNFELVGIATSAAAEFYSYLSPTLNLDYNGVDFKTESYKGDIYAKKLEMIMYGVTQVTSVDAIRNFLKKNKDYIQSKGFDINDFIKK